MALYIGVSNVARKVKKMYVGVNGIARQVKKLYVGVNGIARKVFGGGVEYHGTATDLDAAKYGLAAAKTSNYAMFAGGSSNGSIVNVYNDSLTLQSTTLTSERINLSGVEISGLAVFGSDANSYYADAFNDSVTKVAVKYGVNMFSYQTTAHTGNGNYGVFAGGQDTRYSSTNKAYALNSSLTITNVTNLSTSSMQGAGGTAGDYAVIYGGTSYIYTVDAYNNSLTKSTTTGRMYGWNMMGTTFDDCALIAGGSQNSQGDRLVYSTAYIVNASLTCISIPDMSVARHSGSASSLGDYALIMGGIITNSSSGRVTNVIDAYDRSFVRSNELTLSVARAKGAATTVGSYILYGGGRKTQFPTASYSTVDAYEVS